MTTVAIDASSLGLRDEGRVLSEEDQASVGASAWRGLKYVNLRQDCGETSPSAVAQWRPSYPLSLSVNRRP